MTAYWVTAAAAVFGAVSVWATGRMYAAAPATPAPAYAAPPAA